MSDAMPNNGVVSSESSDLAARLCALEQQAAEYLAGWQRARADYQNLKKESERKQLQFISRAREMLLEEVLPIYDSLRRALAVASDAEHAVEWRRGIEQIKNQWDALLKRWQVEQVVSVGQMFDPLIHEAVGRDGDGSGDVVVGEVEGGYRLGDKVLYPAKVVVGIKRSESDELSPSP